MRFIIEGGGRSGVRTAEALGYALETYHNDNNTLGDLYVDFAKSHDQPGNLFRQKHVLLQEMTSSIAQAIAMAKPNPANLSVMWQNFGEWYWAEAERMVLSTETTKSRRKNANSRRKSL